MHKKTSKKIKTTKYSRMVFEEVLLNST